MVNSEGELQTQLQAISKALWVLRKLGMTIAPTKCAVLLHLGGTAAKRVRARVLQMHNQKMHITFQHEGHSWRLPVVTKHEYLGATLSYNRMEDLTATRRIRAAQISFERLKPVLTHRGLPLDTRLRVWKACVITSLLYSLPQVGLTKAAAQRISVVFYRQLRHITRQPVHLTGTSNRQLCQDYHVCDPIEDVAKRVQRQREQTERLQQTLATPDARLSDDIITCEARLVAQLQYIVQAQCSEPTPPDPSVFPCPYCDYKAGSKTALTKHCKRMHQLSRQPSHYLEWKQVDRFEHGTNGLPTCRWCGTHLSSWQQLQRHIHDDVCQRTTRQGPEAVDTQDGSHVPTAIEASTTDTMLMPREVPLSNAELITSQPEMPETPQVNDVASCLASLPAQSPQNLQPGTSIKTQNPQQLIPVERDSQIMHKIQQHPPLDVLQQCPHLQDELLHHCCLCRQWTPARGGTKTHLRGSHTEEWKQAGKVAEHECLTFASHVTSTAGCPFCLAPKFADRRAARAHVQNCQVLFQIMFLRVLSQPKPAPDACQQHRLVLKNGDRIPIAIAVPMQSRPTPEQSQFLLRHCCICAQTQPDLRSLKTHLHKAHPRIWLDTDSLSRDCKVILTTADKTCPYCSKTSRIAKDHAPYCPVLYQFCLLKRLHCDVPLESNPLKRSKPEPETLSEAKGQGSGKGKGKGNGKGKGRWSRESTWDTHQETRHRPFGPTYGAWKEAQGMDMETVVYAIAKLCLRQETELSELRQEKSFLLHVNAGPHGILKPLIQASIKWNELRDQMKVDCSLKSELFRMMLKETAARMAKFEQTPESVAAAEKAKWITTQPITWLYQRWDPDAHLLTLDPSRPGLEHQAVKTLLESMSEALKEDPAALNQFTPKRKLTETMTGASVAFKVTVGFRSSQCQTLYDAFAKLAGLSVLQLIAANMHKERQKHGREAEEVRNLTWRYSSGSGTRVQPTRVTSIPPFCFLCMRGHRGACKLACWARLALTCRPC